MRDPEQVAAMTPDDIRPAPQEAARTASGRLVYLAGRFTRRAEFNGYADRLRSWGFRVDARWLVEEHEWYGEQDADARDAARRFATDDLEDVTRADIVLVFTEPPKAGGRNRGGRHVEYGIALALSKDIVIVGEPENVFHNLTGPVFVPRDELHTPATRIVHALTFEGVRDRLAEWQYVDPDAARAVVALLGGEGRETAFYRMGEMAGRLAERNGVAPAPQDDRDPTYARSGCLHRDRVGDWEDTALAALEADPDMPGHHRCRWCRSPQPRPEDDDLWPTWGHDEACPIGKWRQAIGFGLAEVRALARPEAPESPEPLTRSTPTALLEAFRATGTEWEGDLDQVADYYNRLGTAEPTYARSGCLHRDRAGNPAHVAGCPQLRDERTPYEIQDDREAEVARIAAVLHEAKVDCNPLARIGGPYGVSPEHHARASKHDDYAAALYDAGLRTRSPQAPESPEPLP